MKLDATRTLLDWRGRAVKHDQADAERKGEDMTLGVYLALHLAMSQAVPKDKTARAAMLSIKLELAGAGGGPGDVTLSADDVALINTVMAGTPGMPPWVIGCVRYLTDPDGLTQEERETFAAVYDAPRSAPGGAPGGAPAPRKLRAAE